jgi:hypothetical protein
MAFTAEQINTFADEPSRLFYMNASMFLVPFQVFHRYVGASASMQVRVAAVAQLIEVSGDEMTTAETVTLFNDMCIMAPATLIAPSVTWESVDAHTARATFTNAGRSIRAELSFNEGGELTDFRSDDRLKGSSDGKSMTRVPWSTPMRDYRSFGPVRVASRGDARWHESTGEYPYIELELDALEYNVHPR